MYTSFCYNGLLPVEYGGIYSDVSLRNIGNLNISFGINR
jgi:hypothetical protein